MNNFSVIGPRCISADEQLHKCDSFEMNSDNGSDSFGDIRSDEDCVYGEWMEDEVGIARAVTSDSNDNNVMLKSGGPN